MISTLIRGGGSPDLDKARSEYLVDTENNTIVYPYTLAENILSKDSDGNIIRPDTGGSIGFGNIVNTGFIAGQRSGTTTKFDNILTLSKGTWMVNMFVRLAGYGGHHWEYMAYTLDPPNGETQGYGETFIADSGVSHGITHVMDLTQETKITCTITNQYYGATAKFVAIKIG